MWTEGTSCLRLSGRYVTSSTLCIFTFNDRLHAKSDKSYDLVCAEADDEISFNPDDVIINIEMIDEGWWKGECHGRTGLFPATYVRLM